MKTSFLELLVCLIPIFVGCKKVPIYPTVEKEHTLRELAETNGHFYIGSLFNTANARDLLGHETFSSTLSSEFNIISPEWEGTMETIWTGPYTYDFTYTDVFLNFAKDHNMKVKWTHLIWHGALPESWDPASLSNAEFENAVHAYVDTIIHHCKTYFPGVVFDYNVVNEVINPDGENSLRPSIFLEKIGPDFVKKVFTWAHDADTSARLYICDYDILGNPTDNTTKRNYMLQLVTELQNEGVHIDGVAEQAHLTTEYMKNPDYYSPVDLEFWSESIDMFANLGLRFEISEMDVVINDDKKGINNERLQRQAQLVKDIFELLLTKSNIDAVIFWGLTDKYNWYGAHEYPHLFDENYVPKPSYFSVYDALQ